MARKTRKEEAQERYKDVLTVECPECNAKVGVLCDTPGVWVHFGRFQRYDPVEYAYWLWPM